MPRKVNIRVDYYEDYDDFDDYDYGIEENVAVVESKPESERRGIWSCYICTYDNDDSMSACDICGVLRNPLPNISSTSKKTVEGTCKDAEASIMAQSLFASLPHQAPKNAVLFQPQKDGSEADEGNNFHKLENFQGHIDELYKIFSTHNQHQVNIVPFKFDTPSPDDMVTNGLRSSKMGSKANLNDSKTSTITLAISENIGTLDERSNDGRLDSFSMSSDKRHQVKRGTGKVQGSSKSSDVSSDCFLKSSHGRVEESSYIKGIAIDIESDGERIESSSMAEPKGKHDSVDENISSVNRGKPESLANNLNNMALGVRSGNPNNINARKANSHKQYKPEKWMLPDQAEDALIQLNLAIVGHVDSGKSTLSGRLLHLSGRISEKQMHKYEKEAKIQGKGSFAYAWALDESAEERERGITMTVAVAYFDSKRYHVVVLDSPGHKDFVPNMISGATQADAAIIVIDASLGSFEAGMDSMKGQTREHAQLIRSFGVEQIIVAVNKMDVVGYSKERFDLIKQQLGTFLRSCNFKDSSISWLPLSAMENQNLVAAPSDVRFSSWYKGRHLLDAIDSFRPPSRDFSKPLLMPICDVIKSPSLGQVSACGKLEAGALRSGLKVLVMPSGGIGTARSLERDSQACSIARAGDSVAVSLQGIDGSNVVAGGVLCHPDFPVNVAKRLEVKVLVLDVATPILVGSQLEFHIHHAKEAATVVKILSLLDSKTGKVAKKAPRCLTAKQSAVIEVLLHGPVCVEEFSSCRALGRVFLRALGRTIAVGIVTRIID
ncbi:HBS1-like protein isoform X2 [Morus notabilis]|uniref:HBS1-like protein isoform X2 n=1 Tax=Morus notabilis TaxID=981085 RepID=UPI000CED0859|nr:HBS1-like protein isoform X2 [Morus notabilis]